MLFTNNEWNINEIKEIWFKLEKEMQSLAEKNLKSLLWIEFISTEFQLWKFRIDSLAFDNENNSFVIIEYKLKWSNLDIAQWLAYLSLLLNNKAEFVQKLSIKKWKILENSHIDWSQSKIIFISEKFTEHQKESINFKDLPIELFELRKFNNNLCIFEQIIWNNKTESIKTITKFDSEIKKIENEIKIYDENYHLEWKSENIIELYNKIKQWLFDIDSNIEILPKKLYIAFKVNKRNLIDIEIRKNELKFWINAKQWELNDLYWVSKNVQNTWHWGNWDYEIKINSDEELLKIFDLIQQTYKKYN